MLCGLLSGSAVWTFSLRYLLSGCRAQAPRHLGFSSCGSHGLEQGSRVGPHGLSYLEVCGIVLDQGWCLLHWQADSSPLSHWGSPIPTFIAVSNMTHFDLTTHTSISLARQCCLRDHVLLVSCISLSDCYAIKTQEELFK